MVNGGVLTNNGTIETASGGGNLTVQNTTGSFTLDGTGTYSTSANNSSVIFQANSSSSTGITFGASAGLNATVNVGSGKLQVVTDNVIIPSTTGGSPTPIIPTVTVNATFPNSTTIESSNTTTGPSVTFQNNGSASQLNLNGNGVTTIADSITVNPNVTLSSNNSLQFDVNGGTMLNQGTIQTVAGGGSITVSGYNADSFTLDGSGAYNTSANNSDVIFTAINISMGGAVGLNATANTGTGVRTNKCRQYKCQHRIKYTNESCIDRNGRRY